MNFRANAVWQVAEDIKAEGLRVFLALGYAPPISPNAQEPEAITKEWYLRPSRRDCHGCFTDDKGDRVVTFAYPPGEALYFSGNYRALIPTDGRMVGTGWRIEEALSHYYRTRRWADLLQVCPPYWAVGCVQVRMVGIDEYLKTYEASRHWEM